MMMAMPHITILKHTLHDKEMQVHNGTWTEETVKPAQNICEEEIVGNETLTQTHKLAGTFSQLHMAVWIPQYCTDNKEISSETDFITDNTAYCVFVVVKQT